MALQAHKPADSGVAVGIHASCCRHREVTAERFKQHRLKDVRLAINNTVARELAPAGLRSRPRFFRAAARPSGSKLPRHRDLCQ
ncbi:hypothetical protein CKQ80_16010 [Pseudomonas moraviensis]|uniref:Uncharacterized protein n=1 Tax=Pseudomonas moraviensis TaxID=321662 RepID=A0A2A2PMR6_9PSED|nr:hypothetical protein CKQ68_13200 [Pseudomonas moraviensis]PAW56752.1 hypothetical protein CKQ80_16010 [Pseudomonas moraviensis]